MPITILAPPRSGTSMLARLLNICGVNLGSEEDMAPAGESNRKGYWEHVELVEFNKRLLAHFGGTMDDPGQLPQGWYDLPELEPFRAEAAALVAQIFAGQQQWGWKDPRTTLTAPFWRQIVPGLRFVISVRNPLDVASSIAIHSQGTSGRRKSLAQWQYYMEQALRNTLPGERTLVFYEDFFLDYRQALAPVLEALGLAAIEPDSPQDAALAEFIDTSLRHHARTYDDVLTDPDVFTVTKLLYAGLRQNRAELDAVFRGPAPDEYPFRTLESDEYATIQGQNARIGKLAADVDWQGAHIATLEQQLADLLELAEEQRQALEVQQQTAEEQRQALDWHAAQRASLERQRDDLHTQVAELQGWVEEQRQALDWHAAQRASLEQQRDELRAQVAELQGWTEEQRQALDWHTTHRDALEQKLQGAADELAVEEERTTRR